jgi:hypothetical protein
MRIEEAREAIVRSLPNLPETDIFAVVNLLHTLEESRRKETIHELPNFWDRLMEFRQQLDGTDLNPDAVWEDIRDRTPMPIEPQFP